MITRIFKGGLFVKFSLDIDKIPVFSEKFDKNLSEQWRFDFLNSLTTIIKISRNFMILIFNFIMSYFIQLIENSLFP